MVVDARLTRDPVAPRGVDAHISPQLDDVMLHAMGQSPSKRSQSAAAMREELEHPEKVELTGRCERLQAPRPWKVHWRRAWRYGVLLLVPVVVLVVFLVFFRRP